MKRLKLFFYFILIFVLCAAIYFKYNTEQIFISIGNYYYKQNNIAKAQMYYEKSFDLGCNDENLREIYVNSIINSPLDINSQEKLIKIAEGPIADKASERAKHFLDELKREINQRYPLNYIKQAPNNQKIIRWSHLPITYVFRNSEGVPSEYIEEIRNAFSTWEKAGPILFTEEKNLPADIIIDFKTNKIEDIDYGKKYIVAYTAPQINVNTLENMNINFYVQDPEGNNFSRNQIYNTALHEIFHALGFMGHSYDSRDIMYFSKNNKILLEDKRLQLTEADVSTLTLLYKIKPDITNIGELNSEYLPYLVLGDENEVNYSKIKEAKNYIYHAPTLPGGYVDLAESLVGQKKYAQAIKTLEKALSLADTDEMTYIIYYNLAVSYYYINHMEMALDYIQKAQSIKDSEELHYLLAEVYRKKHIEKSIEEYNYLLQVSPDNVDYVINLINIYLTKNRYFDARSSLKNYLKHYPAQKQNQKLSHYKKLLLIF